ncbi:unnamed protein product, partial [Cuscuta epithymum]
MAEETNYKSKKGLSGQFPPTISRKYMASDMSARVISQGVVAALITAMLFLHVWCDLDWYLDISLRIMLTLFTFLLTISHTLTPIFEKIIIPLFSGKMTTMKNKNPLKSSLNLVSSDDNFIAVVSQSCKTNDVNEWVVDSGATKHICKNKNDFTSYTIIGDGEELVYLADSKTVKVHGKGKVLLKLTSGKTLSLNDVLHVPEIRTNLVSVYLLGKVGVKVSFGCDNFVMTKNDVLVGNGYCKKGLYILGISEILHDNASV